MVSKMIPSVLFFTPSYRNWCSLSFPQIFVPLDFRDIRNLLCSLKAFAESLKETPLPFYRFSQAILKGRNCTNTDLNVYFVYVWCLCVYKSISHTPLIFVRPDTSFSHFIFSPSPTPCSSIFLPQSLLLLLPSSHHLFVCKQHRGSNVRIYFSNFYTSTTLTLLFSSVSQALSFISVSFPFIPVAIYILHKNFFVYLA